MSIFSDESKNAMLQEIYQEVEKKSEDTPYAFEKRGLYKFSKIFSSVWPFFSVLTLLILVFFFARDSANITDFRNSPTKSIVSFVIIVLVAGGIFSFIDYKKYILNQAYWKRVFFDRSSARWRIAIAFIIFSLISCLGSATGSYLLSLEATGYKLEQKREMQIAETIKRYDASKKETEKAINAATLSQELTQGEINRLKSDKVRDKGENVVRWQSGIEAAKLSPTLSKQGETKARLQESIAAMEIMKQEELAKIDSDFGEITPTLFGLDNSGKSGMLIAKIVFVVFVLIEAINIYANYYIWKYYKMCTLESGAIPKNVIAKSVKKSRVKPQKIANIAMPTAGYKQGNQAESEHRKKQRKIINKAKETYFDKYGKSPTRKVLSELTGFTVAKLRTYD